MSLIHLARQGFITKSALPVITRQRGTITAEVNLMLYGAGKTTVSNNTTFVDGSTNNFTITRNGDSVQSGFNPFSGVSNGSGYFDGTGDYLSNASANLTTTGDITVEFWAYLSSVSGYDTALTIGNEASGRWFFGFNNGSPVIDRTGVGTTTFGSAVAINTWYHVAFVRSSNTVSCYVNGVSVGTPTSMTGTIGNTSGFYVGAASNASSPFQGYISNLRVVTSAVYTSNFTPPASPLTAISGTSLLLLMENYSIVNSTSQNLPITVTGNAVISTAQFPTGMSSSIFFDGVDDRVATSSSSEFAFGTGPFTVECYFNRIANNAGNPAIFATSANNLNIFFGPTGIIGVFTGSNFFFTTTSTALNTWYHIAISRDSTRATRIFLDGVLIQTFTENNNYSNMGFIVGNNDTLGNDFNGYVSNFRVVKGAALYTASFTTPSAPLPLTITAPFFASNSIYGVYQLA
jgi:hypothetical protein